MKIQLVMFSYIDDYLKQHGNPLKPVNRRSEFLLPFGTVSPICGSPYEYLYDNSCGRGQLFGCEICKSTFYSDKAYLDKLVQRCPHLKSWICLRHFSTSYAAIHHSVT